MYSRILRHTNIYFSEINYRQIFESLIAYFRTILYGSMNFHILVCIFINLFCSIPSDKMLITVDICRYQKKTEENGRKQKLTAEIVGIETQRQQ